MSCNFILNFTINYSQNKTVRCEVSKGSRSFGMWGFQGKCSGMWDVRFPREVFFWDVRFPREVFFWDVRCEVPKGSVLLGCAAAYIERCALSVYQTARCHGLQVGLHHWPAYLRQQQLARVPARIHHRSPQFANFLPQLGAVPGLSHVDQQVPEQSHLTVDLHN